MSRLAEMRSHLNLRGKSVVSYGADLMEWSAEKNLAVAADIASFAVAQVRLTVEAQDFSEYLAEVRGSISGLGETLQEHGQDYVAKLRDMPGDFQKVVNPEIRTPSRKTTARKKAAAQKSIKTKAA
jgi:phage-related protein